MTSTNAPQMESIRSKTVAMFSKIFVTKPELANKLEMHCLNFAILQAYEKKIERYMENPAFRTIYRTKVLSMHFNLTNPKNPELVKRVLEGGLKISQLVNMTHQEMFKDVWMDVINKMNRKEFLRVKESQAEVPEGLLQCSKCRSKRVHWFLKQTRAADESSSVYASCSACGKRWKFNP